MKAAKKDERSSSISETDVHHEEDDETPLRSYLNQMEGMRHESFSKLLETTVDASCLPSCEHGLESQLDVLMVRFVRIDRGNA